MLSLSCSRIYANSPTRLVGGCYRRAGIFWKFQARTLSPINAWRIAAVRPTDDKKRRPRKCYNQPNQDFQTVTTTMGDRTEEEEERFIKANARRMRVRPERFAELLEPLGFFVTYANRDEGINHISLLRTSPHAAELFETIDINSNIYGETPGVNVGVTIVPNRSPVGTVSEYVSATRFGYDKDDPPLRNDAAARAF